MDAEISDNIANPAVWLLNIWDRLPRSGDILQRPTIAGWAKAFNLAHDDHRVLAALHSVYATVDQTLALVDRLNTPNTKKIQLGRWQHAFKEASVDLHGGHPWGTAVKRFSPERRVHLDFCASELDIALGDNRKSLKDIEALTSNIEALLRSLSSDEGIEEDFRVLMMDLFEAVRRASAEYLIRGNQGVMESIAYIFAGLTRYQSRQGFRSQSEVSWGDKLRGVMTDAANIATVTGVNGGSLISAVAGFLK